MEREDADRRFMSREPVDEIAFLLNDSLNSRLVRIVAPLARRSPFARSRPNASREPDPRDPRLVSLIRAIRVPSRNPCDPRPVTQSARSASRHPIRAIRVPSPNPVRSASRERVRAIRVPKSVNPRCLAPARRDTLGAHLLIQRMPQA
jgi:hypothetical protein